MKNIYKKLYEFQQKCPVIGKGSQGYGYKYADLPAVFETIKPILKELKIAVSQPINNMEIKTIIYDIESGESIESITAIPQGVQLAKMNEFQVQGSAITYYRRYSLCSILGIIVDDDDDAQGVQLEYKKAIANCNNLDELEILWDTKVEFHNNINFVNLVKNRKAILSK